MRSVPLPLAMEKTACEIVLALHDVERSTVKEDLGAAWHAVAGAEIELGPCLLTSACASPIPSWKLQHSFFEQRPRNRSDPPQLLREIILN
jgi:hypothetical protein